MQSNRTDEDKTDALLKKAMTELYDNQKAFHTSMEQFCSVFTDDLCGLLLPTDQKLLANFLQPYRQLTNNPFMLTDHQAPSLEAIGVIISEHNKEFKQIWYALSICNNQFSMFNAFLMHLDTSNPAFMKALSINLRVNSSSRLSVGDFTIKPVQHSMRYKLTLKEISKYSGDVVTGVIDLLEKSTLRINYHMYTSEIIDELKTFRNKDGHRPRFANPVSFYIDSILSAEHLNVQLGLSSHDARAHFVDILRFMHKRLVDLSAVASQFNSFSFFQASNPFLKTLQVLTKKVEQRYIEEVGRQPVQRLCNS